MPSKREIKARNYLAKKNFSIFLLSVVIFIALGLIVNSFIQRKAKRILPVSKIISYNNISLSFINQHGQMRNDTSFNKKIRLIHFFHTGCTGICPLMSQSLKRVYNLFQHQKNFYILSYSVDPEQDSIPVLKVYASKQNVTNDSWQFFTGKIKDIRDLAIKKYVIDTMPFPEIDQKMHLHSEYVILIDQKNQVRGIYNATDFIDVDRLIEDLRLFFDQEQ
ncbi:SCO family protein [Chitinophaga sp. Mgbs1]|uniref:SCO family protein n=1 Tax=Chitinophaga solisilvae TaxID=1233460 RepID=A0A9Q5DAW9_9BACT|nr:SCO family protein [Chitinophaga solisilvae]